MPARAHSLFVCELCYAQACPLRGVRKGSRQDDQGKKERARARLSELLCIVIPPHCARARLSASVLFLSMLSARSRARTTILLMGGDTGGTLSVSTTKLGENVNLSEKKAQKMFLWP